MITGILFLIFACVGTMVYFLLPVIADRAVLLTQKQAQKNVARADIYLQDKESQNAYRMTIIAPIAFAAAGFFLAPEPIRLGGIFLGVVLGVMLPRMYVNNLISRRKSKFNEQLVNAIMIMSSSFRGGLSLVQAIESVVDEMPDPIKQEFGIVLGENKMGVALDEGLNRLYKRMPSIALQQIITSILLARETGGNLPAIFSRIVATIRERRKIEQNLQTLTIQGKIQAAVMTGLPVFFVVGVSSSNPKFFDTMIKVPQGRQFLIIAAILWVVGAFFILKISKFKDF
jgi:tight adherence protein B